MPYLEDVQRDAAHNRYALTHKQMLNATAVCAGSAVLDRKLFAPLPVIGGTAQIEADGSPTALADAMHAFSSGFYANAYGPASERLQLRRGDNVPESIRRWNAAITKAYGNQAKPANFRRIFFEGGLWHVFVDWYTEPRENMRDRFQQAADIGDYTKLRQSAGALSIIDAIHKPFFLRTPPAAELPHGGSHLDAAWFANAALHIGEATLGIEAPGEKDELLASSLPMLRHPALLDILGFNLASDGFLYDRKRSRYNTNYLKVGSVGKDERQRPYVGFDMDAIEDRIQEQIPAVATHNHRGCPVIFQKTPFKGAWTPVFSVLETTLRRIYRETGALTAPLLRVPSDKVNSW